MTTPQEPTQMAEREMLELAALAAGIECEPQEEKPGRAFFGLWLKIKGEPYEGQRRRFNSLTDDGDEALLEGILCLNVSWGMASVTVDCWTERYSDHGGDKRKARRYAGTRAAAEIGRKMKEKQ